MSETPEPVILEAQVTPAHVLQVIRDEVIPRLDSLDGSVAELQETAKDAGLNGHTPLLKAFLEQYAHTYQERQAWLTLRGAWGHRLRWLASPKAWLRAIFYASLGGIGYGLVQIHSDVLPHFLH